MEDFEIKQLEGILNTDDSNEVMPPSHHKMARNVYFRNGRFEAMPGTTEISYTKPTGTNECIGGFYDDKGGRIFWFLHNASGNHSIWQYDLTTKTASSLIVENTNAESGTLNFDLNHPIYSAKILSGDTVNGDELWFINSQKKPCKINISRALSGGYGTISKEFISVAYAPPIIQPLAVYLNDATVTVNNLRGYLFRIKVRYVSEAKNKSVTSIDAEVPLPVNYLDSAVDKDPSKNCKIGIIYPTGNSEVKKVEILVAQNNGNNWDDFQIVKIIDKAELSIPNNDISVYYFYNNETYVTAPVDETSQLYDLVPLMANDVELLNGNVPIFCSITEGYNQITISGSVSSTSITQRTTQQPFLFTAVQSGNSGFGSGNIHSMVIGAVAIGDAFSIQTSTDTISYTALAATTSDVISGLSSAATSAGFTVVSSDTENLVISKSASVLLRTLSTPVLRSVSNSYAYDINSRYNYVLQYFDENGITIGSQTANSLSAQTVNYSETGGLMNLPKLTLSITNRPPLEAKYFSIGRPKNLTKSKQFYWVCRATYKDNEYAYIDIENLNVFIKNNPKSAHLAYDFSPKDRIRFIKVLSGTVNTIYTDNDFEIQAQAINPTVSGNELTGQFLKILLPTTTSTFDFGAEAFNQYYIQVYTPSKLAGEGYNLYYEFGERYSIGDYGLSTRYHQGMTQNQSSDLVSPAIFEFTKGDCYFRSRKISVGAELKYEFTEGEIFAGRHTLGIGFVSRSFTDLNIITGDSPMQDLAGWTYSDDDRAILKMGATATTTTFKIKGNIKVDPYDDDTFYFFFQKQDGTIYPFNSIRGVTNSPQIQPIDVAITLAANEFISALGWSADDYTNAKKYFISDLKIEIEKSFTVPVIDMNFSDYFSSSVNSNGRAFAVNINAKQATYKNLFRWGLGRQFDTNINGTNRFKEQNGTEVDLSKGSIWRMVAREGHLRFFQERGVGVIGVYKRFIRQADGSNVLTTTDEIITKDNFDYYAGNYGIGNHPTSLVSSVSKDFFIDPIRGYQCMVGGSGIEPISLQHYGEYTIQPLFPAYNRPYLRSNGSLSKIMGYYDFGEDLYVTILQGGTLASFPEIQDYTFAYRDSENPGYVSFQDIYPEWIISAEDKTYSWENGSFYIHNNTSAYCNFYGVQYYPSVRVVFNKDIPLKKLFLTSAYQANKTWSSDRYAINTGSADSIKTSFYNPDTGLQQISELKSVDYSIEEGKYCAALLKDKNSGLDATLAVLEGDELIGNWMEIEYLYRGNDFSWIFMPQITFNKSNKNF